MARLTLAELLKSLEFKDAPCGCDSCASASTPLDAAAGAREAAKFAEISAAAAVPTGAPLPARFIPIFTFARMKFAIDASQAPAVKMVAGSALPPGATGQFLRESNTILVRAGLDDDDVAAVLLHEFAHSYERGKNWSHSEQFAEHMEHKLMSEWRAHR